MALFTSITGTQWAGRAAAAEQRVEEDALYAVGEQFNNLNACALASASCVSTQNDDEKHFIPPWQYDGPQATAIARLVAIATGVRLAVLLNVYRTSMLFGCPISWCTYFTSLAHVSRPTASIILFGAHSS